MPLAYNELYFLIPNNRTEKESFVVPAGEFTVHNLLHLNIIHLQYNAFEATLINEWLIKLRFVKFFENYWIPINWIQRENEQIMEEFFLLLHQPMSQASIMKITFLVMTTL